MERSDSMQGLRRSVAFTGTCLLLGSPRLVTTWGYLKILTNPAVLDFYTASSTRAILVEMGER